MIFSIKSPPLKNPWGRIDEVAKRLGVEPGDEGSTIVATGNDGKAYDVWEVVIAFLDRMEKVCEQTESNARGQLGQGQAPSHGGAAELAVPLVRPADE